MIWQILYQMVRLFNQILSWRILNNLLGLIGFWLGVLSILLAYWGVHLTKRSTEAVLDAIYCKAFIVKIKKKHYIFAQVVLRNLGRAWLKLLPLMRTSLQINAREWWQYFDLEDYLFNQEIWRVASRKFEFAINCLHINNNPEVMLFPDGMCVAFYYTGRCDKFIIPKEYLTQGITVKIEYAYETEKGKLKLKSLLLSKEKLIGNALERKIPAFTVKIPVTLEID